MWILLSSVLALAVLAGTGGMVATKMFVEQRHGESYQYVLLAVSGTLEEGFELRPNLDHLGKDGVRVPATFLGKALVRGYKSFLDIKTPGSREYTTTGLRTVNPAVVPTGCDEHANRYSIYVVEARQALRALAHEPRFLSIAPDMGLADLTAADDLTSPEIRALARAYATDPRWSGNPNATNLDRIAFLTVTSTWFQSTFVANGILRNHTKDGSITDYPESTAIWSRQLLRERQDYPQGCGSNPTGGGQVANVHTALDYQTCIDAAIRIQEQETGRRASWADHQRCDPATGTKHCFVCQRPAHYGTDNTTARFHRILEACELEDLMVQAGLVDPGTGGPKFPLMGCSLQPPNNDFMEPLLRRPALMMGVVFTSGMVLGAILAIILFYNSKQAKSKRE